MLAILVVLSIYIIKPESLFPKIKKFDRFGIVEIYPTKVGGREWFIDMDNPTKDGLFNPQSIIQDRLMVHGKLVADKI